MPGPDPSTATQLDLIAGHFGKRLKYWRLTRQLTQAELARDLNLDGSYVSKLESSRRRPSLDIARQCDDLLDTGGELADLLTLVATDPGPPVATVGAPLPTISPTTARTTALPAAAPAHATVSLNRLAEAYAEVAATMGGHHLGESVERQAQEIIGRHIGSPESLSGGLLRTAARFARLAAAIRLDSLDEAGALYWNDCAGRWALDGGDPALSAEMCARTAIVYAHRDNAPTALTLATRAEQLAPHAPTATVWSLLAQAHAHAASAEPDQTTGALATAHKLLTELDSPLMANPSTYSDNHLWHWHAGLCHLTLARHDIDRTTNANRALDQLRQALSEVSVYHTRELALTRLALAHAYLHADDPVSATAELTEAATLARACTSPRLHTELAQTTTILATTTHK
ncbi:helix-turn-helix domain-containing protein [Stackebrandtia nassauensis]|uniref:Transcriptional regulator, XRE family n=1 Tax=Stackebrandtia nassauensis (strain DSM 44728 / CIP 108903 / NRRL B-16338 / NBRC 102104 / LLR-40K-21) TaxID=446470 RepID=D3Q8E4_STANL|nr:helix-turn-helix transcriptional regulator [Stackebrandtia nassauensis]ADD42518.1 transcriptional regulator, XRE family [Stackebrandtia nassauensis DSM 44728]